MFIYSSIEVQLASGNTQNSKDSGSKSSPSFRTSVFNVRRIRASQTLEKSENRHFKSPTLALVSNESSNDNKPGSQGGGTFCINDLMVCVKKAKLLVFETIFTANYHLRDDWQPFCRFWPELRFLTSHTFGIFTR